HQRRAVCSTIEDMSGWVWVAVMIGLSRSNFRQQFVDACVRHHALGDDAVDVSATKAVSNSREYVLADENVGAVLFVEPFEPSRQVHDIAEHRIVHGFGRSAFAHSDFSDNYAITCRQRR